MMVNVMDRDAHALREAAKEKHQAGALDEAAALCERALAIDPDDHDALHVLGLVRFHQNALAPGRAAIERALALDAGNAAYLNSLGVVLIKAGDYDAAISALRRAVELGPRFLRAYANLATAQVRAGKAREAIHVVEKAMLINHNFAPLFYAMSEAYASLGNRADAQYFRGGALMAERKPSEALPFYQAAIKDDPNRAHFHNGLGSALFATGRAQEAAECYQRALKIRPGLRDAIQNLGQALIDQRLVDQGMRCLDLLIEKGLAKSSTHIIRAQSKLRCGRFEEGWAEFEWRLEESNITQESVRPDFDKPAWDGAPLGGKRLLVHTEQGKGDILQFARFLPRLRAFGGTVVFECEKELLPLMPPSLGYDEIVAKTFSADEPYPPHDLHISLLSLPHVLGLDESGLRVGGAYLSVPEDRKEIWAARIAAPGFRVGLVWAGNPLHPGDHARSIPLQQLAPLGAVPGATFYSLQVGDRAGDPPPPGLAFADLGAPLADYADTAAVIEALDLVISVDTSVAHLAGALGRPVWTLIPYSPDWRWLYDRADSPWYPSMRLFRQPQPRDWDSVVAGVAVALSEASRGPR